MTRRATRRGVNQRAAILLIVAAAILVGSVAMWSIPTAGVVAAAAVAIAGLSQIELGEPR